MCFARGACLSPRAASRTRTTGRLSPGCRPRSEARAEKKGSARTFPPGAAKTRVLSCFFTDLRARQSVFYFERCILDTLNCNFYQKCLP